jgi:hypothetical protein
MRKNIQILYFLIFYDFSSYVTKIFPLATCKKAESILGQGGAKDTVPLSNFPAQALVFSGKIKDRSRAIFGTGDNLRVITVTANSGQSVF